MRRSRHSSFMCSLALCGLLMICPGCPDGSGGFEIWIVNLTSDSVTSMVLQDVSNPGVSEQLFNESLEGFSVGVVTPSMAGAFDGLARVDFVVTDVVDGSTSAPGVQLAGAIEPGGVYAVSLDVAGSGIEIRAIPVEVPIEMESAATALLTQGRNRRHGS